MIFSENRLPLFGIMLYHFRRQAPREDFIVDFVCLRHRLIVEIDGGQHNYNLGAERDRYRDARFAEKGFRILRFWNHEIDGNLDGVLDTIMQELKRPHPVGSADHPPPAGEG
jgi:very-short-patch-repair endonuclease